MKKIQCGGFYVDDEAIETREGKPFLKTGGSDPIVDPIVDNAKETGGIGWTDEDETVHKIDEKYLPEAGGGAERFLVEISGSGDTMTANHTSAEIATAFDNGKYIVATWNDRILQLAYVHPGNCRFVGLREGWLSNDNQYVEGCSYAEVQIQGDAITGFDNYIDFSYFQPKN